MTADINKLIAEVLEEQNQLDNKSAAGLLLLGAYREELFVKAAPILARELKLALQEKNPHLGSSFDEHMLKHYEELGKQVDELTTSNTVLRRENERLGDRIEFDVTRLEAEVSKAHEENARLASANEQLRKALENSRIAFEGTNRALLANHDLYQSHKEKHEIEKGKLQRALEEIISNPLCETEDYYACDAVCKTIASIALEGK